MNKQNTKPPALIIGGSITCLGVLRSLARTGIEAFSITWPQEVVRRSRWYRPVPGYEDLAPDQIARCLDAVGSEPAVLFPCSDDAIRQSVTLLNSTDSVITMSAPPLDVLETFIDKSRFAQLGDELGIPRPRSWILEDGNVPTDIPGAAFENAFLKPLDSQSFIRELGVKAYRVASREVAEQRLRQIGHHALLLQEYIPGPSHRHFFIDGFMDRKGLMKAMFARRRLRMDPPDFGNSSFMVSVPLDDVAGAASSLRKILEAVDYRGIFSAEFKLDDRDGEFKIIEINARPWWYVEFASRCGVNVCEMAYADALGEDVAEVRNYRVGSSLVYSIHDFRAWRRTVREDGFTWWSWVLDWLKSWRPIFAWDDPWPAIAGSGRFLVEQIRKRL